MDSNLKYSETIESSESNPLENLLCKPAKKPVMKFKKSKVLARYSNLLKRRQEEEMTESGDLNIENILKNKPYIKMRGIGFSKESDNESDPKIVLMHENVDLSSSDEDSGENESKDRKAVIEDISEQTLSERDGRYSPTRVTDEVSTPNRTVDDVLTVVDELIMQVTSKSNCEEMVY